MRTKRKKSDGRKKRSSKQKNDAPPIPHYLLKKLEKFKKAVRKGRRRRSEHSKAYNEAQNVQEFTVSRQEFAGDLIARFVKGLKLPTLTQSIVFFDYQAIAEALAAGDPETRGVAHERQSGLPAVSSSHRKLVRWPQKAIWERYSAHFQDPGKRRKFFDAVDTKRFQHDIIFLQADAALRDTVPSRPDLLWDEALLPTQLAPHVFRQWMRDSKATQKFLILLFGHFARFHAKGSMGRRAVIAAGTASNHNWKSTLIAETLVKTGDISLGEHDHEVQKKTVLQQQAATIGRSMLRIRKAANDWADKHRRPRRLPVKTKPG